MLMHLNWPQVKTFSTHLEGYLMCVAVEKT